MRKSWLKYENVLSLMNKTPPKTRHNSTWRKIMDRVKKYCDDDIKLAFISMNFVILSF